VTSTRDQRNQRDRTIAALLRAGATYAQIKALLRTSDRAISRVRHAHRIPLPPSRARRSPAQLKKLEAQAVNMLRAGATQRAIYAKLKVAPSTLARLRKEHRIPVRPRRSRLPPGRPSVTGRT
jgi:DNA-binding CsgD family transcriptional regulator